jgi:branched-chain amino acid transport system permease protein
MNSARGERIDDGALIILAMVGAAVPFVLGGYELKLATTIAIQAGLASALGLVVGAGGLVSLGHGAIYGFAAYIFAAIAPQAEPANLGWTLAMSVIGATALAAAVGAISIRARGLYFILMTLAFGQLGFHLFHDSSIVGTADGAYINFRPEIMLPGGLSISVEKAAHFYILVFILVALVVWCTRWLRRSSFGSVLTAARDNEARVRAFGYSPYFYRLALMTISGALAGVMGYLAAAQHGFVAPQMLAWHVSATSLVMVLIGGKDAISGPAVGAVILLVAEEVLQRLTEHWLVGVGVMIVAVVLIAPNGVIHEIAKLLGGWSKKDEGASLG